jgi:hypothetical protein
MMNYKDMIKFSVKYFIFSKKETKIYKFTFTSFFLHFHIINL